MGRIDDKGNGRKGGRRNKLKPGDKEGGQELRWGAWEQKARIPGKTLQRLGWKKKISPKGEGANKDDRISSLRNGEEGGPFNRNSEDKREIKR